LDSLDKDSGFRTPVEELKHLENELAGIRSLLREATTKLAQIERHVWRAFPTAKSTKGAIPGKSQARRQEDKPSLVHETALELFETLRRIAQSEGGSAVEKSLSELSMADLRFLSQELGLPSGSKLSRAKLNSGISGRLNESILLARNVNITLSRSEQGAESNSIDSNKKEGKAD